MDDMGAKGEVGRERGVGRRGKLEGKEGGKGSKSKRSVPANKDLRLHSWFPPVLKIFLTSVSSGIRAMWLNGEKRRAVARLSVSEVSPRHSAPGGAICFLSETAKRKS